MLAITLAATSFTLLNRSPIAGTMGRASPKAISVMAAPKKLDISNFPEADSKRVSAAVAKVKTAAAAFGPAQRDAANVWLEKTLAGQQGFSSADLWSQKVLLFEECLIEDDGSSTCQKLEEALATLQDAMVAPSDAPAWGRGPLSGPSKKQKAAQAVRAAAAKFGLAQQKQANAWVEKALKGMSTESLIEEELNLFGECALSKEGSKEPNKCVAMSKVRQAEPMGPSYARPLTGLRYICRFDPPRSTRLHPRHLKRSVSRWATSRMRI